MVERTLFDEWGITPAEYSDLLARNANLRGISQGYVAEDKLQARLLDHPEVSACVKMADQDRNHPYDFLVTYRGSKIRVESKGPQSGKVTRLGNPQICRAIWKYDTTGRRKIKVGGCEIDKYNRPFGECDVNAVPLFDVIGRWEFAFILNRDLKPTTSPQIPAEIRHLVCKIDQTVRWPPLPPYYDNPFGLFDTLVAEGVEGVKVTHPEPDYPFLWAT